MVTVVLMTLHLWLTMYDLTSIVSIPKSGAIL